MMLVGAVLAALVCVASTLPTDGAEGDTVEVMTKLGSLRGVVRQAPRQSNRTFYSFKGIPFAKPPIGPLRLKDPVASEAWTGVRDSIEPPVCPQADFMAMLTGGFKIIGEEDCLYLHVYTPSTEESALLPVMVYIHGGGYNVGFPDSYGGSPLPLLNKDIVLVSLQYRLGNLGFLSTEDDVLPGNLGLKDQTLALRWVQDNIRTFGGDPNRVTIFGESAGAGSVHFQMLSPSAAGLFQRAILQSGNALCPWSLRDDHRQRAEAVGTIMGCPALKDPNTGEMDSNALLTCLQEAPLEDIMKAMDVGKTFMFGPFYMVPRVDGDFLPAHPAELMQKGQYNQVDVISGVNANEGSSFPGMTVNNPEGDRLLADFDNLAPLVTGLDEEEGDSGAYMSRRIFYHYLGTGLVNFTEQDVMAMDRMATHLSFAIPHDVLSQFTSQLYGKSLYLYQLDHRASISANDMFNTSFTDGMVAHGDDIMYLFEENLMENATLERADDLMLKDIMVDLWTNFAATGVPTPTYSLGFKWEQATPDNLQYLSLTPAASMKPDARKEYRDFLLDLPTKQNKLLFPKKFYNYYN